MYMKQLSTLLVFFLATIYCYGQQPVDVPKENNHVHRSEKVKAHEAQFFGCTQCTFISKVKGTCPYHATTLLRFGTYYCPANEHYTSTKKGSCPEHKAALKEMVPIYKEPNSAPAVK